MEKNAALLAIITSLVLVFICPELIAGEYLKIQTPTLFESSMVLINLIIAPILIYLIGQGDKGVWANDEIRKYYFSLQMFMIVLPSYYIAHHPSEFEWMSLHLIYGVSWMILNFAFQFYILWIYLGQKNPSDRDTFLILWMFRDRSRY